MNEITITGNIVYTPQLRSAGTQRYTRFRLAHNHSYRDAETGAWRDNGTTFIEVTCWRNLAENVCASLGRGSPVIVTGRLRSWERDIEGAEGKTEHRTYFEIEASNVGPDLLRGSTRAVDRRTEQVSRQEDAAIAEALGVPSGSPFEPAPGALVPADPATDVPTPDEQVPAA
jgi:single-strand DNA-binding protein